MDRCATTQVPVVSGFPGAERGGEAHEQSHHPALSRNMLASRQPE